jgi:hypothetical protein
MVLMIAKPDNVQKPSSGQDEAIFELPTSEENDFGPLEISEETRAALETLGLLIAKSSLCLKGKTCIIQTSARESDRLKDVIFNVKKQLEPLCNEIL